MLMTVCTRYTSQSHALERMSTVWLLPVVPLIVAASSGGLFSLALLDEPLKASLTVAVSAFMVIIGLSLAFMMLTVYLLRLIVYGLPQGATVLSVFLPIGPMGQAGFAIILIGRTSKALLPIKGSSPDDLVGSQFSGEVISILCVCIAFTLWALATMWLVFALLGLQHVLRRARIPFKVTFWGLIFPNVRTQNGLVSWLPISSHVHPHRESTRI
jgi:tellurite resistance protein TehA-like permease